MPTTLQEQLTDIRFRLSETIAARWTDAELAYWVYEALRVIARRAETIELFDNSMLTQAGQADYYPPFLFLRIHRMEFAPANSTLKYPMQLTRHANMDQRWGAWQSTQSAYPSWAIFWGAPGSPSGQKITIYPVPSQQGFLRIWYYGLPRKPQIPTAGQQFNTYDVGAVGPNGSLAPLPLDIVEGYWDLVALYVEYTARRKDRDDMWSDAKDLFEFELGEMIDKTREWHDQADTITRGWEPALPSYYSDGWWA